MGSRRDYSGMYEQLDEYEVESEGAKRTFWEMVRRSFHSFRSFLEAASLVSGLPSVLNFFFVRVF